MNVNRKVAAGGLGGALVIVIVAILGGLHIVVDPSAAVAAGTLVTFAISWLVPEADTTIPVGASVDVVTKTTVTPTPTPK